MASREHPTQKPIELIEPLVQDGCQESGIVLDPFCGSGTTLIAAERTGRICYGMEIEPMNCQLIINRWEAYTGQKAVKIGENHVSQNSD
jgi:DNA modification methylase